MTNCKKNAAITLLGAGSLLEKNIRFSTDFKEVELYEIVGGAIQCINDINSNDFLGINIVNNELFFTASISGLNTNISFELSNNPLIKIKDVSGALEIIGIDDINTGFAVQQVNVRFDGTASTIEFQI
ncbi:MAG: hypothetical protein GC192_05975 [Bacteroidetes bacterium]|nr:hypothetical protein [Bacteroidota bacterium]